MGNKKEFLLYNLEPSLKRLKEDNLKEKGVKEKYIKKLFGENLQNIFSDLIFLEEEHYLLNPDTNKKDCVADTLAFSKKNSWFVVIEYKREESLELYEQTAEYISCLKDTKNPACIHNGRDLVEILKVKEKSGKWNYNNIHWDKTKGICIATEIHKKLRHHQRHDEQRDENIKIVEIKFYDEKKFLYIDTRKLPEWLTINLTETITKSKEKFIESRQNDKEGTIDFSPSKHELDDILSLNWIILVKDLLQKIDNLFPKKLVRASSINHKRLYAIVSYFEEKELKKRVFVLTVTEKQIIFYGKFKGPQEIPENFSQLLNTYGLEYSEAGSWAGKKHWRLYIKNDNDFRKLKNFIQEFKKQFSENSKIILRN